MLKRDWVDQAKCRETDPRVFDFPESASFCAGCRVIQQCATEAFENRDRGVVRAGIFLSDSYYDRAKAREKLKRLLS